MGTIMKTKRKKLSPCLVVPMGDPNPRTHATYVREVQALLQATHRYSKAQAEHATSPADWGPLVRAAWASGKAPCWSADHIAKFDSGGASPLRGKSAKKSSRTAGAITRKRRDPSYKERWADEIELMLEKAGYAGNLKAHAKRLVSEGYGPEEIAYRIKTDQISSQLGIQIAKKGYFSRDPNCYRSSRTNLHTHTVCLSKPGTYTTSSDFAHTHTVKFKKNAVVTTSEDFGHTHDFDFSVKNGRDPAHRSKAKRRAASSYTRSIKSKRKLARRATPRCANLLKRLTTLAKTSVKYRRAGRNLASKDAWKLLMKVSDLAVKEGCGEVQVSEAIEDGVVAGRKSR